MRQAQHTHRVRNADAVTGELGADASQQRAQLLFVAGAAISSR